MVTRVPVGGLQARSLRDGRLAAVRAGRGGLCVRTRRRLRARGSRGASSIEYGLLVALIGAALCIGIGYTLKAVFADTVCSLMAGVQGHDASSCPGSGNGDSGGGTGGSGGGGTGGGGGTVPTVTPKATATPTATPTPTPTATPTP
jgi:Flp pilus assembly pilin Flp